MTRNQKINIPGHINHSDDELAFLSYYPLLNYETDPKLREVYTQSLDRSWQIERPERNPLWNFIYAGRSGIPGATTTYNPAEATVGVRFDPAMLALARTPQALVDYANLVLAAGALPKAVTDRFVASITAMPAGTGTTYGAADLERVRSIIYLTVSVPQGAIQK